MFVDRERVTIDIYTYLRDNDIFVPMVILCLGTFLHLTDVRPAQTFVLTISPIIS